MITRQRKEGEIVIAEFIDLKRFTLTVTEEIKAELKPILNNKGTRMILDFTGIDFVDSSAIGGVISLVKTAKGAESEVRLCCLSKDVASIFELLHLQMIIGIEKDLDSCIKNFS